MMTILLGAGASVEAGVPAAANMIQQIYDQLQLTDPRVASAVSAAIGGLQLHNSSVQGEPFSPIDIEKVYEILTLLAGRESNLISPFVGAWSHAVQTLERPDLPGISRIIALGIAEMFPYLAGEIQDGTPRYVDPQSIRRHIEHALREDAGTSEGIFTQAAQAVLREIRGRVWITDPAKVAYLEDMVSFAKKSPIWVASLNYDNAVEFAAANCGSIVDYGISEGKYRQGINFTKPAHVYLAKLHGSVNWSYDVESRLQIEKEPSDYPVLIFGAGNKLKIDGPFLDLLFAFRDRLRKSTELYVCGYSFRDQHINHLIIDWLSLAKQNLHVFDPCIKKHQIERNVRNSMPGGWHLREGALQNRIEIEHLKAGEWVHKYFAMS